MREILFRGKALYDGDWVYRSYVYAKDEHIIIPKNAEHWGGAEFNRGYLVDPETVGQYTGITDKDGKRIFEGDIVRLLTKRHPNPKKVVFDGGAFCHQDFEKEWMTHELRTYEDGQFEVIGNIHDNPELIEGE